MLPVIGLAAAVLTTGAWLPQLLRCWRTRSADDLSWGYLLVLGSGLALWSAYGAAHGDLVILLANALSLVGVLGLCGFKVVFRRPGHPAELLPPAGVHVAAGRRPARPVAQPVPRR
jgi:MtN3 and saliva related transmembrane protein